VSAPTVTRVVRVGRSLYVCIPTSLHDALAWRAGDRLVAAVTDGGLMLRRLPLEELVCAPAVATVSTPAEGEDG